MPLTSQEQLRFIASDIGSTSTVEAAIDDMVVYSVSCTDTCAADFDGNGVHEVPDIFAYLSAWFAGEAGADVDGVPGVTVPDIFAFLSIWFAGC